MHLMTVSNRSDAESVRDYMTQKWKQWSFRIRELSFDQSEFSLSCEYVGKKPLTTAQLNMMINLLPCAAQSFYQGRKSKG